MSARPWMPLYIGDFIADTMHLGATETGIYIRLIMHCWQHGAIPRDPRQLALISHCDTRLWRQYEATVLQFFDAVDASTMHHKRVTSELLRSQEISNKRKGAAQQKQSKSTPNAEHLHTQSQSQSQSQKKDAADAALPSEEADYFRRGKQLLGPSAGGLLVKLKTAKGSIPLARAALEMAATKQSAREYLGRIIAGKNGAESDQLAKVDDVMRRKGCAVVFADEVQGGIPGIT